MVIFKKIFYYYCIIIRYFRVIFAIFFKIFIKLLIIALLLLPPIIPCYIWNKNENKELFAFSKFEFKGPENISFEKVKEMNNLVNALHDNTKDKFPVKYNQTTQVSELSEFNSKLSEGILEKIGIFSYLPYHKVCLINNNRIYINGTPVDDQPPQVGGLAINQEKGYNFYAKKGEKDCKNVLIDKFRTSSSSPEVNYPIVININGEENIKRLNGKSFLVSVASSSIEAKNSKITIYLNWWALVLAYLILLFAWSFVFFQYEKIINFIKLIFRK